MTGKHFVVVDGSNLATEGRKTPKLAQLDEAVRSYVAEDPDAEIVVVVDASFEHRIDASEAAQLEQAELHGELVSPPAGAIGRGDAFVLRIAERTGASVLSNDSFQEFHDEHPWLFEPGRLIGGKPVPGVGWIFTPRTPVRGHKSRQSGAKGKSRAGGARPVVDMAPAEKAAELAKAARRASQRGVVRNGDGSVPAVGDVWVVTPLDDESPDGVAEGAPPRTKKGKKKAAKSDRGAAADAVEEPKSAKAPKAGKTAKATKTVKATKATKAAKTVKAAKVAKVTEPTKATKTVKAIKAVTATKAAKATKAPTAKKATKATKSTKAAKAVDNAPPTAAANRRVRAAIVHATAEALDPAPAPQPSSAPATPKGAKAGKEPKPEAKRKRRRTVTPPPAVNEPMSFINFVAAYPMGGTLEGDVASFTSHGAMVEVEVPDGGAVYCYIPLAGLGVPPPVRARDVLVRGERRRFVLVGLDPARRVAELALPELGTDAGDLVATSAGS